ncbi:alpha/beta fold hydrolase [Planctomycetota bacterium]
MFEYVEREQEQTLVFIPGWAFDCRIFAGLDLPYNYLFYNGQSIGNFEGQLQETIIARNIQNLSLFGWSQGAFAACNFASKNPDIVNEVILSGVKKKYEKEGLEKIKNYLSKNAHLYLSRFYKQCFCKSEKEHYEWFRDVFLKDYMNQFSPKLLAENLDWMNKMSIEPKQLMNLKQITILHGETDAIAPVEEAIEIANSLPGCRFISFEQTGHLPFLREDFASLLYD